MSTPPVPVRPAPQGYSRAATVGPKQVARATAILNDRTYRYDDEVREAIDGVCYVFRVEPHYDTHATGKLEWHRGVSVFVPTTGTGDGCGAAASQTAVSAGSSNVVAWTVAMACALGAAYVLLSNRRG